MRFLPLVAVALLGASALSGCMKYTLTPDRPAQLPKAPSPPLPLKVGLLLEEPRGSEIAPRFAEALREARLFDYVRYPLPLNAAARAGVDLVITGRFGKEFIQDPLQGPKIFFVVFTGFFTGALMDETSHHKASGSLSVESRDGIEIKAYDHKVDVVAVSMVSAFAEKKAMDAGPPAAADNLVAKLVQDLIDDRPYFERLGSAPPAAAPAPRPVAAVVPSPEPALEPQAVAAVEPASAPQPVAEPESAPRRPLTTAEEAEIDEQIMP